jgi:hypothetical protein
LPLPCTQLQLAQCVLSQLTMYNTQWPALHGIPAACVAALQHGQLVAGLLTGLAVYTLPLSQVLDPTRSASCSQLAGAAGKNDPEGCALRIEDPVLCVLPDQVCGQLQHAADSTPPRVPS